MLEAGLTVIQTCSTAKRRYPSYPFDRVVEQLFSELENGVVDDEIKIFLDLGEGSKDVLDFLEDSDTEHSSVQPDQWKNDIRTGLEDVSPEIIRPLVDLVDRMDEALWERRHLHEFSWEEFERLVADVFESEGYETRVTQSSSDKGIDIWARSENERIAIQVKQYSGSNTVGRPTLQKIASTIATGDADRAIVATSNEFANTAKNYADDFGPKMQLIDGTELIEILSESEINPPLLEEQSRTEFEDL